MVLTSSRIIENWHHRLRLRGATPFRPLELLSFVPVTGFRVFFGWTIVFHSSPFTPNLPAWSANEEGGGREGATRFDVGDVSDGDVVDGDVGDAGDADDVGDASDGDVVDADDDTDDDDDANDDDDPEDDADSDEDANEDDDDPAAAAADGEIGDAVKSID